MLLCHAGVIIVAVANCATIIALGVWVPEVVEMPERYAPHSAKANGFGNHGTHPVMNGDGAVPHGSTAIAHGNGQAGPDALSTV